MANKIDFLTFEKQLDLFESRGMIISERSQALKKLQSIGYYKIKGFAYALIKPENKTEGYKNVSFDGVKFDEVILRYYQDKNLRMNLMHAIEKIEVSVKVQIAYVLGKKYGAYGYTDFSKWTDRKKLNNETRREKESEFCDDLKTKISRSGLYDLSDDNLNEDGMPSIWLAMDILTFGDIVYILSIMAQKNLNEIANYYNLDSETFVSWMYCLKFIRNLCAHNSNIIDIRLKTRPKILEEWQTVLYKNSKGVYSNRIANVVLIIKHFISKINPKYSWHSIHNSFDKMIDGSNIKSNLLGFHSYSTFNSTCPKKKKYVHKKSKELVKS